MSVERESEAPPDAPASDAPASDAPASDAPASDAPASDAVSAKPPRLRGLDLARALAILGMVLINFQVFLLLRNDGSSPHAHWLAHLPSGRSSALFVTLAGAGMALMSRGSARRAARWTLLTRAGFLLVAGNLLILVWSIDILHFYAFYLGLGALLLLALPRPALPPVAALFAFSGVALRLALPDVARPTEDEYWTALGMLKNVVGWGIHPLLPWLGFLSMGLWIGRHDLADAATRRRLAWIGAALATATPLLSAAIERALTEAGVVEYHRYLGTNWSPAPLYVFAATGTSMFAIAMAQELAERFEGRWPVRALVATGQLSLTIYILHALVGVGVPR